MLEKIKEAIKEVKDPEIPVLSIVDLGIITQLEVDEEGNVFVRMTPTFAGCPAMEMMRQEVEEKLTGLEGVASVKVKVDFKEHWTSNRISEEGRETIRKFGLAPPVHVEGEFDLNRLKDAACPYCGGSDTTMNSPFGPTLCRSIHYCYDCKETFEQFKPV
ncbi:MAG: 1,2-phenylacetyl-CoA epoxidase subunit PaaD [Bacteroidia bacterium]